MTVTNRRQFLALPFGLAVLPALAGCGGPGEVIRVSSKEFTEQMLLGALTLLVFEAAGLKVSDKTGIAGSNKLRSALLNGDIDVYWEYTGTGWLSHLQHEDRLADPETCYRKVRDEDKANGIIWLPYAAVNNTYTVMMRETRARELGLKNLSDLAAVKDELSFAVDHEFTARPDGLPGLAATYGGALAAAKVVVMDNAIVYKALKDGQVDMGMGFSTDGRIAAFGLVNLVDDRGFFPAYNPSPNVRADFLAAHPAAVDRLAAIAAKLDNAAISHMNYLVDIEGKTPRDVAAAWAKSAGLIAG
jgi:osmoprotectant transport system substrate-binding protein